MSYVPSGYRKTVKRPKVIELGRKRRKRVRLLVNQNKRPKPV